METPNAYAPELDELIAALEETKDPIYADDKAVWILGEPSRVQRALDAIKELQKRAAIIHDPIKSDAVRTAERLIGFLRDESIKHALRDLLTEIDLVRGRVYMQSVGANTEIDALKAELTALKLANAELNIELKSVRESAEGEIEEIRRQYIPRPDGQGDIVPRATKEFQRRADAWSHSAELVFEDYVGPLLAEIAVLRGEVAQRAANEKAAINEIQPPKSLDDLKTRLQALIDSLPDGSSTALKQSVNGVIFEMEVPRYVFMNPNMAARK